MIICNCYHYFNLVLFHINRNLQGVWGQFQASWSNPTTVTWGHRNVMGPVAEGCEGILTYSLSKAGCHQHVWHFGVSYAFIFFVCDCFFSSISSLIEFLIYNTCIYNVFLYVFCFPGTSKKTSGKMSCSQFVVFRCVSTCTLPTGSSTSTGNWRLLFEKVIMLCLQWFWLHVQ